MSSGLTLTVTAEDLDTLVRTIFGEARGEGPDGRAAVAWVVRNRACWTPSAWWGNTIRSVCRKGAQFSCWNVQDKNRLKMLSLNQDDELYIELKALALAVCAGSLPDPTASIGGATQYKRLGTSASWDRAVLLLPRVVVGRQEFWRLPPV